MENDDGKRDLIWKDSSLQIEKEEGRETWFLFLTEKKEAKRELT